MIEVITPPATDLVSLVEVKAWLAITDDSSDDLLSGLISRVSSSITTWIGDPILEGEYRETLTVSPGQVSVVLSRWPAAALSAVTLDGQDILAEVQLADESGLLIRLDGAGRTRPWQRGTLVVEYTAGRAGAPGDIKQAALTLISAEWSARGRDPGLRSIGIGDISLSYLDPGRQPSISSVAPLLEPYRSARIG